ncbi:2-oxoglutarate (2OG) and Fe(II)-dependent oxygenase family protein [Tieghemostelium lacteum]|uniref:2-oxoglutarate (2OG) and Fe(II)-dependent oxygenase family protein n=1 Tax=Tieghemostelium lacteum TaxID=361077 RepID=A0A151Z4Q7_TIELA|nr:2-oxoglutarate (2OG) and Fe(II)-dependent oxygenase family protein [Tieghemostelium lacteum]|eukprot:KYQ88925.1 2-oxoglutarate (2OG) and Fe(II)-dependent oxygenase family protein [Tieghemostelium lacteum]
MTNTITNYLEKLSDDKVESPENEINKPTIEKEQEIKGLTIIDKFITKEEHDKLLEAIKDQDWDTTLSRRTQHYGYRYNYKSRNLNEKDKVEPLPEWSLKICQKLIDAGHISSLPDQLIVNEYKLGQGISAHIDSTTAFGDVIFSISLGAPCRMIFKRKSNSNIKKEFIVRPRTFMKMSGDSRYLYTHEIPKLSNASLTVYSERISLTFRYLLKKTKEDTSTEPTK